MNSNGTPFLGIGRGLKISTRIRISRSLALEFRGIIWRVKKIFVVSKRRVIKPTTWSSQQPARVVVVRPASRLVPSLLGEGITRERG